MHGARRSFFSECVLSDCLATGPRGHGAACARSGEGGQRTPVPSRNLDSNWGRVWGYTQVDTSQMKVTYKEVPELLGNEGRPECAAFLGTGVQGPRCRLWILLWDTLLVVRIFFFFFFNQCERETSIGCLLVFTPTEDQTCNLGICPDWESNPRPFGPWNNAPTN